MSVKKRNVMTNLKKKSKSMHELAIKIVTSITLLILASWLMIISPSVPGAKELSLMVAMTSGVILRDALTAGKDVVHLEHSQNIKIEEITIKLKEE